MRSNQQQLQSEPILSGRLQDLDVGNLLSALRLGRQYLTLEVYDANGDCTGVVAVKAGRIVSASVDGYTGTEAVRRLLQRRESAEFRVLLPSSEVEIEGEPLGTIAVIHESIIQSEVRALSTRTRVLQGVLSEQLSSVDVLRSLAFSRQHITFALSDATGNALGDVEVKASQVLSARAGDLVGLPALRQLLRAPAGSSFVLFAEIRSVAQLQPLGSVAELLSRDKEFSAALPISSGNGVHKKPPASMPTQPQRARILEGGLDEFELSDVLKILGTSRQHFELQVHDESALSVGVIEVKSGQVIAASTDNLTGVSAAHELLRAHKGRFVAIRRADRAIAQPALVSVSELLQPKAAVHPLDETQPGWQSDDSGAVTLSRAVEIGAPDNAGSKPIPVMDGKLGELDVTSILLVAGASRQYTCVHILDDQRSPLGVIHLKSGQVVRAQAQDVTGVAAVRRLLHCPRDFSFLVQRYPHAHEVTTSIGSIAAVLTRAAGEPAAASVAQPSVASVTQFPTGRSKRGDAPSSTWMGGAVLGAGFVLLGGIATAVVLRSPVLNTSMSAISTSPHELTPAPAPLPKRPVASHEEAPLVQPETAAPPSTTIVDAPRATVPADFVAPPSRAAVASLQAGLHQLGYDTGPIDGVMGPRTAAAIKSFQYAEHLTVDGELSSATRAVLLRRIEEP